MTSYKEAVKKLKQDISTAEKDIEKLQAEVIDYQTKKLECEEIIRDFIDLNCPEAHKNLVFASLRCISLAHSIIEYDHRMIDILRDEIKIDKKLLKLFWIFRLIGGGIVCHLISQDIYNLGENM